MGLVAKQSLYSFASSYAGMALGMLNKIFLFPLVFKENDQYWGLLETFLAIATIIGSMGHFGMPGVLKRFLPGIEKGSKNLVGFTLLLSSVGCIILLIILFFGKPLVVDFFASGADEGMFSAYYGLLLLLVGIMLFFDYFSAILISNFKSHLPIFLNNVVFRVGVSLCIAALYVFSFSLETFLYLYILLYLLNLLIAIIYLAKLRLIGFKLNFNLPERSSYLQFGFFSVLAGSSGWLINYLDTIFVFKLIGSALVPILAISKNMVSLVHVPARAVVNASVPLISKAWQNNDKAALESIYKKSAITEIVIGGALFLAIWINVDFIISLIPDEKGGNSYAMVKYVLLILGVGRLIDLAAGANGAIISNSKYYRYTLAANVGLIILVIILNLWLTPIFGVVGAAIALGMALAINNAAMVIFLWKVERIQPFSKSHLITFVIYLTIVATLSHPFEINMWVDLIIRNLLYVLFVSVLLFYFKPVPELVQLAQRVKQKLFFEGR